MLAQLLINVGLMKPREQVRQAVDYPDAKRMNDWKIGYSRDGRFFVMGWVEGKWEVSSYIKEVGNGIVTDVHNVSYIFGQRDHGEWEYSLRLRWPAGWEWFKNAGVI